ncbi:MAG: hypothetical protein H6742_04200 [Alphaproteobacteria bacterium]|nr:hypothetical protein [Alphaproteobacteria bacterium]
MIATLFLSLLLPLGCDLYNADDSGADGACPTDRALVESDLTCGCGRTLIESLPAEDCVCDVRQGLVCGEDSGIPR